MNKSQHATAFANKYYDPHGSKEDQKLWKIVLNAVLHGIEIGYDMGFKDGLPSETDEPTLAKLKSVFGPHIHLNKSEDSKPLRGGFAEEP